MTSATVFNYLFQDAKLALVANCSNFAMGMVLQEISLDDQNHLDYSLISYYLRSVSACDRDLFAAYSTIQHSIYICLDARISRGS